MNPCLILVVNGWISVVVYVSLNGSSRPSSCQVVQKILSERTWFEFMNKLYDQLLPSILTTDPRRVVKHGEMKACYRNIMSREMEHHML